MERRIAFSNASPFAENLTHVMDCGHNTQSERSKKQNEKYTQNNKIYHHFNKTGTEIERKPRE